jgi:hypothetical protein
MFDVLACFEFELVRLHIFILYKDLQKSKDSNGRISHQFGFTNWWEACPILWLNPSELKTLETQTAKYREILLDAEK